MNNKKVKVCAIQVIAGFTMFTVLYLLLSFTASKLKTLRPEEFAFVFPPVILGLSIFVRAVVENTVKLKK